MLICNSLRTDCIISGISLYTPNLLLVLAYVTPEEDDNRALSNAQSTPKRGFHRRRNGLQPEMRIIDITTKEEVCVADTLNVSRFESLSATDYHLGVLPVIRTASKVVNQRGTLETIGGTIWDATMYPTRVLGDSTRIIGSGLWDATMYPTRFFTSAPNAPSSRSNSSISERQSSSRTPSGIIADNNLTAVKSGQVPHPATLTRGMKIFIQSPYDCVLATRPTISDHLAWLDSHEKYEEAWNLLDAHPEAVNGLPERTPSSSPATPTRAVSDLKAAQVSLEDFFADDGSQTTTSVSQNFNSQVEKEKRRIGDRWVQQLVNQKEWSKAGEVCGRVLGTSASWERWIWVFAHENKYAEITPYIPTTQLQPPLPSLVYEDVLGHYILQDRTRLKELLDRWPPELFDVNSVIHAIQGKLNAGDVREDTIEGQETGRDWRILMECLAKLYLADARAREALKCYIKLHDADSAMALISTYHLIDALSDDIPGLILLRVSKEQQKSASLSELEELTAEPIRLLVDEAHHGIVRPETVVSQLKSRPGMLPYLFFYLRALWNGDTSSSNVEEPLSSTHLAATEGKSLVSDFADLAVELFAEYDRPLLLDFLKTSQSYTLSTASTICEKRQYIPELVYLLSKEGRTKKALFIIIENLQDVSQAIAFAKVQDDPDLWNDLLDYSMNKPSFIRGLLEEVGTAIDPIKLVRRIPEGLEIEGLREGLSRMIKEYELQDSISEGVARVLRGEVAIKMEILRGGRKRGIKFEVGHGSRQRSKHPPPKRPEHVKPGHCWGCGEVLLEDGSPSLFSLSAHLPLPFCIYHANASFDLRFPPSHLLPLHPRLPSPLSPILQHPPISCRSPNQSLRPCQPNPTYPASTTCPVHFQRGGLQGLAREGAEGVAWGRVSTWCASGQCVMRRIIKGRGEKEKEDSKWDIYRVSMKRK